ncbi:14487_t:CDS:2, partial [Cetraspora pellucida]
QQLKAARAKKYTSGITNILDYKNLDDLIWSANYIDEKASDYFAILLTASKNMNVWKPSSRPSMYIEAPALTSNVVSTSTSACELSMEVESIEIKSMKSTESIELIKLIKLIKSMKSMKSMELIESMESMKMME